MSAPQPVSPAPTDDPVRDPDRLAEIVRLDMFSDEVRDIIADMTTRAAERFDLPISQISVVLDEAQFNAAQHGLDGLWIAEVEGHPVEWSFCRHAVRDHAPFIVEDTMKHERTKDNPLVKQGYVRCYAGIPLITSRDHVLGSLCVIGPEPRAFADEELKDLRAMADEVMRRIEDRATKKGRNGAA
jgi:GAF domain-containing protein